MNSNDDATNEGEDTANPLAQYESILAPLREKHDEIVVLPAPKKFGGIIVVAAPLNESAYQVYTNNLHNERADKYVEARKFALACIFHPDQQTAKQILQHRPGLVTTISNHGTSLAGAGTEELGKD